MSEDHRQGAIRERVASPAHIQTVLNGIDLTPFEQPDRAAARRELGFAEDDLLLGVGSRLAPKKGLEYLLAALPPVLERFPTAQLVLFGDGPLRTELETQAEQLGIRRHIHFPGFRRDVPRLLGGFDVVLQPSLSEGLSISILEAMAAGRPLIACDIQGNREVVRHGSNGLLVPPADAPALTSAMLQLLSDPARAQALGDEAARDCRTRFSEARMVEETLAVYDRVCRQPAPATFAPEIHSPR